MRKIFKFLTGRLFIISMLILIQILLIVLPAIFLSALSVPIFFFFLVIDFFLVLAIVDRNYNSSFKIAWLIPVLSIPVGGALLYILFGRNHLNKKNTERLKNAVESSAGIITADHELLNMIGEKNAHLKREASYIINNSRSNIYAFTETEFLNPGSLFFERLVVDLNKAEHFIFLEYFIIGDGEMWRKTLEILTKKAAAGVEVRLLYDDIGTINLLPSDFPEKMEKLGIRTAVFNPYKPSLDQFLNYRDHRKFAIIDGKTAYTGGINIADEYINRKKRFGFWEDSSVKLDGDAVKKVTVLFLEMWYFTTQEKPEFNKYLPAYQAKNDGFVIPFSDEPLFQEMIHENAYINVIDSAKESVYICTPYLILDNTMESCLIRAAKSGIDIKIITPHHPDKKMVFEMTRSNYQGLIDNGVEIYEFTPGFMHTKMIISDGMTAIVGTCNFDFRSFYLHFENGVWMYRSKAVKQAQDSFFKALSASERITPDFFKNIPMRTQIVRAFLKIFSPLM
ncbi:MAG: cardiolipin synthase [Bacteroides sp.]|nr:cardiolipin synthase [Eubacterium sp.]MCM1417282.1 cardiolipin synthase [Roseburia sp.]MCM1461098.1 cardiolipin synthase [Bacteroides sp.]